jgi:hypothetical protein
MASPSIRAVSIHTFAFERRAMWHLLEENATQHRGSCKDQNRNRCSGKDKYNAGGVARSRYKVHETASSPRAWN